VHDNVLPEEFFYELAARVSDRMMEELPSEEELSRQLSFSPGFERRMELLLANPKSARAQEHRALRVLAIAAAIIILLISAMMSVSAIREAVFKFFATLYETYIVVRYEPEEEAVTAPETILEFREPSYIPPGYVRDYEEKSELFHFVFFLNSKGQEIVFEQALLDRRQFAIDIEDGNNVEQFEINGTTGVIRAKNGLQEAVWTDNEYSYKLSGMIELGQTVKMIHSIQ